eukprot:Protomagalhaensia_wolfi_Nauph_80__1009@NODE_1584_length_1455_cov_156_482345_g1228_i0_p1_GENE_NODE_1584_length_1455_cov_156_482345_g1228_i0NODE_1584_length_1455_cov_156_482345_g1228_i0_p1_ORF_typecomplete_len155_score22_14EFhand_8/PF13833_6/6_5EFhand_8/PF13833_6/2_5e05EFhand_8/PF13833_6/7_8e11EFhand_7/PF13499_6/1_6e06EFhand_7/PF13499_6/5_4e09EFhand_6/PF13405_6/2_4e05EFhand_6/PF13405_6/16EFhand_6/PF13405_6/0_0013EFhand_1/PF00036_32/8_3e02EFhand_1/PF00036_32/0_9EFhand_1/PF00036_32/4_7e03EFhand_1/PF
MRRQAGQRNCCVNRDELAVLFKIFDTEEVGSIDKRELKAALRALGLHVTIEDLQQILRGDRISFEDFCLVAESRLPERLSTESLMQTFELLAGGQSLDLQGLRAACDELGEEIPDEELAQMISHADQDGDGIVTFDDFQRIIKRKYDPFASDSE